MKKLFLIIPILLLILIGTGCEDNKIEKNKIIENSQNQIENVSSSIKENIKEIKKESKNDIVEETKTEEITKIEKPIEEIKTEEVAENEILTEETTPVDLYANFRNPQTGEIMSPKEFVKYWDTKCSSQNKIRSTVINNDGIVDCLTYNQSCQQSYGPNSTFGSKNNEGLITCVCKNGYILNADNNSCEQQQIIGFGDDPYRIFDDGVAYSPEQRAQIECAYYGYNCQFSTPVQNYDNYQDTSLYEPTQTNEINCSDYQIEKANLDQQYANNGALFSGAKINAENVLKTKYPGCF